MKQRLKLARTFLTPDFEFLLATKVLSSYQRNQLDLYWNQQLDNTPENVWYELSSQPLLVNTMSSANINKLFDVFDTELLMASFLNFKPYPTRKTVPSF